LPSTSGTQSSPALLQFLNCRAGAPIQGGISAGDGGSADSSAGSLSVRPHSDLRRELGAGIPAANRRQAASSMPVTEKRPNATCNVVRGFSERGPSGPGLPWLLGRRVQPTCPFRLSRWSIATQGFSSIDAEASSTTSTALRRGRERPLPGQGAQPPARKVGGR
jgi:hypothetical protein